MDAGIHELFIRFAWFKIGKTFRPKHLDMQIRIMESMERPNYIAPDECGARRPARLIIFILTSPP